MKKHTGSVELKWYTPINKKLKVIVSFFFSVQIFDFTNSKTRPIYETLIKKMVDTLRLSTLHKSMKRKINQVYFTVQPSDSVSHLALFEFLDFVTWPFMFFFPSLFSIELEFLVYFAFNIWCDSHSNIKTDDWHSVKITL